MVNITTFKGAFPVRKIEANMVNAINNGRTWHSSNTSVDVTDHGITVRLHGHKIAQIDHEAGICWVTDAGWQTTTTKSRLNAILRCCVSGRASIHQKASIWHLTRGLDATTPEVVEMDLNAAYAVSL